MWNENPMKVYAKNHPGCSLQEYCEYLDGEEQKRRDAKKAEDEENERVLKSYVGKCFRIDFNGQSFMYFRLSKEFGNHTTANEDCYEVYISSNEIRISYSKQRAVNVYWVFPKDPYYSNSVRKCEMISDETFDKIRNYYEEMINMAPKIKDMEL